MQSLDLQVNIQSLSWSTPPKTGRYDKISRCDIFSPVCGRKILKIHFLFIVQSIHQLETTLFSKIDNIILNYKHKPISTSIIQLMNSAGYYLNKQLVQTYHPVKKCETI